MKTAWVIAALSSLVAIGASIAAERFEGSSTTADLVFLASFILGTTIIVGLHARFRNTIGSFFGGTNRYRIHVLTVGDIALILLVLQIFSAGLALSLLTAVIFTHNIYKSYCHEVRFGRALPEAVADIATPLAG